MSQVPGNTEKFTRLSELIKYPTVELQQQLASYREYLSLTAQDAAEAVTQFTAYAKETTLADMQELYTRTFEINPVCALEVGWQLFGERYERGTLIVKMRQTLRELGLTESTELPDHLTHVLQVLDRLCAEEASEFAGLFVVPAMEKMIAGFKDKHGVYHDLLKGILCEVKERCRQGANHE